MGFSCETRSTILSEIGIFNLYSDMSHLGPWDLQNASKPTAVQLLNGNFCTSHKPPRTKKKKYPKGYADKETGHFWDPKEHFPLNGKKNPSKHQFMNGPFLSGCSIRLFYLVPVKRIDSVAAITTLPSIFPTPLNGRDAARHR